MFSLDGLADEELVSIENAALHLGVKLSTMYNWRSKTNRALESGAPLVGPIATKIGARVMYTAGDLRAYKRSQRAA